MKDPRGEDPVVASSMPSDLLMLRFNGIILQRCLLLRLQLLESTLPRCTPVQTVLGDGMLEDPAIEAPDATLYLIHIIDTSCT